ncbi:hypothetical protein E2C01_044696 [Portunus trituberculatus]|uniref:Uncharacterized protein n=1 Tax=Portunus trituberculatus TaxID=210409 RepID=A0A5B7FW95_PORTR|nr:hypothetical protein [Portunus trituberculatus]
MRWCYRITHNHFDELLRHFAPPDRQRGFPFIIYCASDKRAIKCRYPEPEKNYATKEIRFWCGNKVIWRRLDIFYTRIRETSNLTYKGRQTIRSAADHVHDSRILFTVV